MVSDVKISYNNTYKTLKNIKSLRKLYERNITSKWVTYKL